MSIRWTASLKVLVVFAMCCVALAEEPQVSRPNVANLQLQSFKLATEHLEKQHQLCLAEFQREFQAAREMTVEQRLRHAADVTAELRLKAEAATAEQLSDADVRASSRAAIFPRYNDLVKLLAARPWFRDYYASFDDRLHVHADSRDFVWPTAEDGPALRKLIDSDDFDVAAMAIEALATLHEPEDLLLLAQQWQHQPQVVPVLAPSDRIFSSRLALPRADSIQPRDLLDPLVLKYAWHDTRLDSYVQRAMRLMTGCELDKESYLSWISKHRADRESLWYWQQRMQREFDSVERHFEPFNPEEPLENRREKLRVAQEELRAAFSRELAKLSPEAEAKVRLLAMHRHAGGPDVTNPSCRFLDAAAPLRLPPERLLALMNREELWPDVDWTNQRGDWNRELYSRLVERIALSADQLLRPEDVTALRKILAEKHDELWWSGQTALNIGISRLLPAAPADRLDDVETREGWLRHAIRNEKDVFVRGYAAKELVRVGLTGSRPFLSEQFFAEKNANFIPDLRMSILKALGEPPLTAEKFEMLAELTSDPRLRPLMIKPNTVMGNDMYRLYAALSLNAYAGRNAIEYHDIPALAEGDGFEKNWAKKIEEIRELAAQRRKSR